MSKVKDLRKEKKGKPGKKSKIWLFLLVLVFIVSLVLFLWGNGILFGLKGQSTDRINILILGKGGDTHVAGNLTDTIMLLSIKPSKNKVAMISIPRDLEVEDKEYGTRKINSVYKHSADNGEKEKGIELIEDAVSKITGEKIHYYAMIDFVGFKEIVEIIDGVDVEIEKGFYDYFHKATFKAGTENMNGERALLYSRVRFVEGVEGTDFARTIRQQNLIFSIKSKILSSETLSSPQKIDDLIKSFKKFTETNLALSEIARIWSIVKDIEKENIAHEVYSTSNVLDSSKNDNGSYVLKTKTGNYNETKEIAENIFDK